MHRFALPLLAGFLVLGTPSALAGTPDSPEVLDKSDDGGLDQLDIQSLWVDTNDTENLTFHLVLAGELPEPETPTSHCVDGDCVFASLTYRVIFRVLGPDGAPLPTTPDYNRSYVAYRHGPNGTLVSPVGTYDDGNVLTLNGSANVTVDGSEIVLRIPRANPAVNMPLGAQPGTRIEGLYTFDSPQACTPTQAGCAPLVRPVLNTTPSADSVGTRDIWDRAPDVGTASAAFAAPPAAPPSAPPATPAPTQQPAPTQSPSPRTEPTSQPEPETETVVAPAQDQVAPEDQGRQESPGLPPLAALAILGLAAIALRRRL